MPLGSGRRRTCLGGFAIAAVASSWPLAAHADLRSAAEQGLPMLGRFERLQGANAFIGSWELSATDGPQGTLSLLRDGDVELRASGGRLVGTGVAPWTYVSPPKGEPTVRVRFSLDVAGGEFDVLYYEAAVDSTAGPQRKLEGSLRTGYGRKVGDFSALPLPVLVE